MCSLKRVWLAFVPLLSLLGGHFVTSAEPMSHDLVIERFPAEVRSSWDYRRTFYVEIHDTVHGGVSQMVWVDSLHAVFVEMDTVRGWECFKYHSKLFSGGDVFFNTQWYAQPETAFLEVAYFYPTHAGPPWKSPSEVRFEFGDRSFESIDQFRMYLYQLRISGFSRTSPETTFWKPPKKLFVFPMRVGMLWVSMGEPWKEEREVAEEEKIRVPGGDFHTLRIEMRPDISGVNLKLYEWLSEEGVIKDSAHFGPSPISDEFGQVYGYMVGYDRYELVGPAKTVVADTDFEDRGPSCFSLDQNYPNPFNRSTVIRFSVSVANPTETSLKVYNILGQEVRNLVHAQKLTGTYEILWDACDSRGNQVASGVYFYRLKVGQYTKCRRMLFLE